jgi:hypothetical protein
MSNVTYQLGSNDASVPQTQTGAEGAADVNVASGTVGIDQSVEGLTNAVCLIPSAVVATATTVVSSTAYEASHILKSTEGNLYAIDGYNSKAGTQFILLFDSATLPAEGAIPKLVLGVATATNFSRDFGVYGLHFQKGIVVCNSSTGPTKTIGSADCFFTARII